MAGNENTKMATYMFAGLAMMLNIRLVYSAAPYALMRFKLPENLFSVFVRVMASSLELWCLPSMVWGNISELPQKEWFIKAAGIDDSTKKELKKWMIIYPSIFWSWANFATFGILWIVYRGGGDQGNVTAFYWVIAASGFVFGINMVMVYAMEFWYLAWYMVGENSFPMVTSLMHYVSTSIFGNRRKYDSDYIVVYVDIIISLAISLVASVLWTYCYHDGNEGYPPKDENQRNCVTLSLKTKLESNVTDLTYDVGPDYAPHEQATGKCNYKQFGYYACLVPPCLMVLVGMGLVYTIYPGIAPGMIVPFYLIDKIEMILLIATAFPPVIIAIVKYTCKGYDPYILKGSWGVYHKKVCKGSNDPERCGCPPAVDASGTTITSVKLAISGGGLTHTLTLNGSGGTVTHKSDNAITLSGTTGTLTIDFPDGAIKFTNLSIDNAGNTVTIQSGSKVSVTKKSNPFDQGTAVMLQSSANISSNQLTINKATSGGQIEANITGDSVVLNYSSGGGSITINVSGIDHLKYVSDELHDTHKSTKCCIYSKQYTWSNEANPYAVWWNIFNILMPLQICLAATFIYSLHYRDSAISRAIINQPKMSTILSIVFYMCHEILLAAGFPGIASDEEFLLPTQLVGAFLMVLLAFYSIGYITEYKRHDPSEWPTDGMTWWNSVCYWLKMASKITNKNFKQLFTTDLNIYLVIFIKKYFILCLKYTILQNL